ncbi:hypothetical protein ACFYV7_39155 [Nocardia suismassiliense]|uniref:Uncharacterized protein n=1 Tax=Nocardia suismassiliense TaxID=2077092 RepID=A0ABW6R5S2_9NOCA
MSTSTGRDGPRGPHATPHFDLDSTNRKTACWHLRVPEDAMTQPCVELVAWFSRQHDRYQADLVPFVGSDAPFGTRWTPPKIVSIASLPGPKGCEHTVLEQLFRDAMNELLRRFDAGDLEVSALFDPRSEIFHRH